MTAPKIYLAGPDVFLPNAKDVGEAKKALCAKYGLEGVFPLDEDVPNLKELPLLEQARGIYAVCENLMHGCDAAVANCTPFRGVSMDIGTGYELGFMRALGKPVFGYSNVSADLAERTRRYNRTPHANAIDPYTTGTEIEDFGLFENLMVGVALQNLDCDVVLGTVPAGEELTNLDAFEECLGMAADALFAR